MWLNPVLVDQLHTDQWYDASALNGPRRSSALPSPWKAAYRSPECRQILVIFKKSFLYIILLFLLNHHCQSLWTYYLSWCITSVTYWTKFKDKLHVQVELIMVFALKGRGTEPKYRKSWIHARKFHHVYGSKKESDMSSDKSRQ